jgi:5-methyltetrahydropteroyltriglutamate--homocysteine methyltransferase
MKIKVYRADQVGSLLRPPELLQARTAHAEGNLPIEQLRKQEDQIISEALEQQRKIGIDIFTDGELRRGGWSTHMAEAVEGFVSQRVALEWKGPGAGRLPSIAFAAGGKLRKHRHLSAHELPFLKSNAGGPFKVTVPAPSNFLVSSYKDGVTDRFYPDRVDFLSDLVDIVRDDLQWLTSEGVPYIQLDAPYYSHYLDETLRDRMHVGGRDPNAVFQSAIEGDNRCLSGISSSGVTIGIHVCRGNNQSRWYSEGGYDAIAERLFGSLNVDTFLLEYDSDRAGGFEPLRFVPQDKSVVLGLITTKQAQLETVDALRRRIDEAARHVPLDNLAISPQCGFASVAEGNLISFDDQWRKLELVVETARKVWG